MSLFGYNGIILDLLGFYTVFFAVGYALTSALFPGRTALLSQSFTLPRVEKIHEISILERIVISVALSAVTIGITGVLLTRVFYLNESTVLLEISIYAILFTILAIFRRISWIRDPFILQFSFGIDRKHTNAEKLIAVLIVLSLAIFSTVMIDSLAKEPQQENFAEMYISGPDNTVESLPSVISGVANVNVNIVSHMSEDTYFTLIVSDGLDYTQTVYFSPSQVISIDPNIGRSTSFYIEPGENYEFILYFSLSYPGEHLIYFTLISEEEKLQLWMPVNVSHSE